MKTLLIDADLYVFSTAIAFQSENPFSGALEYDKYAAQATFSIRMAKLEKAFDTTDLICFFSCKREDNWRKDIIPSYKANREGKAGPIGLKTLTEYAMDKHTCITEPRLEADDLLGIYATNGDYKEPIICSYDKDMLTIPTTIFNSNKNILKKQGRVDALKCFIYQVIIGDSSDGFKGIPGCGPVAAKKFIAKESKRLANIWEPLVELATTKGMDEDELIKQARMAHILQSGDYDFEDGTIKMWEPTDIERML